MAQTYRLEIITTSGDKVVNLYSITQGGELATLYKDFQSAQGFAEVQEARAFVNKAPYHGEFILLEEWSRTAAHQARFAEMRAVAEGVMKESHSPVSDPGDV